MKIIANDPPKPLTFTEVARGTVFVFKDSPDIVRMKSADNAFINLTLGYGGEVTAGRFAQAANVIIYPNAVLTLGEPG